MTKPLFVLLILLLSPQFYAQQTMTLNNASQIPATSGWEFICENYALTGTAQIQVAKTEKGGLLKITVQTTDASFYIGGVTYVYLEDQTILVCTDKNMRESKDGQISAWYWFTAAEMSKLRNADIASIRFNIRGNTSKFSSQIGNFTAVNKKAYFSVGDNKPQQHETAKEITAL